MPQPAYARAEAQLSTTRDSLRTPPPANTVGINPTSPRSHTLTRASR